jgi:hypothetical protein
MWNWLNCYLSGRHDYGVTCSSGSIFLRCIHCGKRSEGWMVHGQRQGHPSLAQALPFTPRQNVREQRSA